MQSQLEQVEVQVMRAALPENVIELSLKGTENAQFALPTHTELAQNSP